MSHRPFRLRALAGSAILALLLPGLGALARADDDDGGLSAADPGVARVSVTHGNVAILRADTGDTYAAVINAPLAAGDYVTTDDDARGEIEFDFGAALRVAPDTQLRFTDLRPRAHRLQLAAGTVDLRLFRGLAAHPEVETPAATIRPAGNGSFRITVTNDGDTVVTARIGRVYVVTAAGTNVLEPGPTLLVRGDPANPQVQTIDPVAADGFDGFNRQRDAFVERARDWAYVDAGFVGADDLDSYGEWTTMAGYGSVWQPNDVPDGWAPYHTGRWVWEPYYGWSWVDDSPWGYAPYHYGRWFYADGGWFWSPGFTAPRVVAYSAPVVVYPQPVSYRPALVAFFSFGGGIAGAAGFGAFGFGNIGWCPLAPSEPYHPWYGRGASTTVVNVTIDIARTYRNSGAPGGAVAVNNGSFAAGNFRHITTLTRRDLVAVSPVRGVVPVVPTVSNLAFATRPPARTGMPVSPRFTRFATTPKTAAPSFVVQQHAVAAVATKTYPEHAAVFAHPDVVQKFDRPGLITKENAPPEFLPNPPLRTGPVHGEIPTPVPAPHVERAPVGVQTDRARLETPRPFDETPKPLFATPKPLGATPRPLDRTPRPVEVIPKPLEPTPKPFVATPRPFEETPKPFVATPRPFEATPRPVIVTPRPIVETPRPVVATPRPIVETPRPVVVTPRPVVVTPRPIVETPRPVVAPPTYHPPLATRAPATPKAAAPPPPVVRPTIKPKPTQTP